MSLRMALWLSAKLTKVRPKAPDHVLVVRSAGGGV
jgi:hypothetical protein